MTEPIPTPPSPPVFRWQDYAVVDGNFGRYKKFVEQSLDSIAATPEGQKLFVKAKANINYCMKTSDKKILFFSAENPPIEILNILISKDKISSPNPTGTPGDKHDEAEHFRRIFGYGSSSLASDGLIGINLEEVRHLVIDPNYDPAQDPVSNMVSAYRNGKPVGLTSVAIHELFHAADPATSPQVKKARLDQAYALLLDPFVQGAHVPDDKKFELVQELMKGLPHPLSPRALKEITDGAPRELSEAMAASYNKAILNESWVTETAKKLGIDRSAFALSAVTPERLDETFKRIATLPAVAELPGAHRFLTPEQEKDATAYTDAYMRKYHGSYLRKDYGNAQITDKDFGIYVTKFQCAKTNLPTFDGDVITTPEGNEIKQPSVLPNVKCEDVVKNLKR